MFNPEDDGATFRRTHSLEGKFIALYAGAHGLSNDLGVVLDAALELREQTNIAIVLLGDGKDKAALQQRATDLELTNLHFLQPVPKTEMARALAAADACIAILKSIEMYKTVYPNKVFDYMAAGRPVILAIDGVIREVVEKAEAGIFVAPGQPTALSAAITQLANDPQAAQQMGHNAHAYLKQHFDRPALASKLQRVIENLGLRA